MIQNLDTLNFYFTILFTIEMLIKMITFGVLTTKEAYLKSPWNRLDFFIVSISIIIVVGGMTLCACSICLFCM